VLVLKSTFDAEHALRVKAESDLRIAEELLVSEAERRIAAEARADAADRYVQQLHEDARRASESHASQTATLLAHLVPLKTEAAVSLDDPLLHEMTADEIAAIPASTSRERALRDARVKAARLREENEEEKKRRQERLDLIVTKEEQNLHALDFDATLGILTEKVEPANSETVAQ